jgi:hypothetical protein
MDSWDVINKYLSISLLRKHNCTSSAVTILLHKLYNIMAFTSSAVTVLPYKLYDIMASNTENLTFLFLATSTSG